MKKLEMEGVKNEKLCVLSQNTKVRTQKILAYNYNNFFRILFSL